MWKVAKSSWQGNGVEKCLGIVRKIGWWNFNWDIKGKCWIVEGADWSVFSTSWLWKDCVCEAWLGCCWKSGSDIFEGMIEDLEVEGELGKGLGKGGWIWTTHS